MASQLDIVIRGFYRQLDKGEAKATRQMAAAYQRALAAYDREAAKVMARIEADGLTVGRAFQYQRLQALAGQAADGMAGFGATVADNVEILQTEAGRVARDASLEMMRATQTPIGFASYATLPDSALRRMVGSLQDGSPLRALTQKYAGDSAREMNRLLLEGVSLGLSPLQTARRMRDSLGLSYSRARTLVRTEQMRAFREVNRATFQRNRDIVKGWKWYAALDRLTCPMCWAMHGKVFGVDESMDTHPNCRCVQVPVTLSFKELGLFGINEAQATGFAAQSRAGQLSNGFQFTAADALNKRGEILFDSLPVRDKEVILGKAAYRAYDSGLVKLSDFVQPTYSPQWGRGNTVRPLSSIIGRDQMRALQTSLRPPATAVAKPITVVQPSAPPVPAPPVALPQPPKVWKPTMTRAEADLWAGQGDLTRPLFHVTSPEGANGITANGFDLSRTKWGRVWGNGAYMSDSAASEAMYSSAFTNPTKIELRVFSRKTLKAQITAAEPYEWGYGNLWNGAARDGIPRGEIEGTYNRKLREIETRNDKVKADILRANGGVRDKTYYDALNTDKRLVRDPAAQAITETCEEYGYDAIDLHEETHTTSVGGSQVIVFDPKRVTVVKDK